MSAVSSDEDRARAMRPARYVGPAGKAWLLSLCMVRPGSGRFGVGFRARWVAILGGIARAGILPPKLVIPNPSCICWMQNRIRYFVSFWFRGPTSIVTLKYRGD